jgi:PAS domain S-box-containing protein
MTLYFDMPTVFMVCSALTVVLSLGMWIVLIASKPYPGFLHWTIGCMGLAIAFTLFAYPNLFPAPLVMVGGNLCFALFGMLYGRGLRAFAGRPALNLPAILGLVVVAVVAYYLSIVQPSMLWRVVVLTLLLLPFYLECVWIVWRDPVFRFSVMRWWLAGAFLLFIAWSVLRLSLMLLLEADHTDINAPSIIQGVTMIVSTTVCVATTIGVIVLNFQRAAESLAQHERRLALAVNATQDAIWERNLKTGQPYYSPRWFEMLGLDAGTREMTDEAWRSLCHPDDVAPTLTKLEAAVSSTDGPPFVAEFRMRHADGRWRWIEARGRLMQRDAAGRPLIISGTNTDITERMEARERQSRLEAQLHQAQKMEALGTLAGGIAHDFNNILLGIMGNVQLAAMDLPPGSPVAALLENTQQASRRARDLIARIMTFSRRHEPNRQPTSLAPIVTEVCALMRATLPAQVTLEATVDPATPIVNGDPAQLHEVIMNLAVNAVGAIGDKPGRIEISLRHGPPSAELCARYPDLATGAQVQLAVRDTGAGMSPEVAERIFEPFFSTKGPGVGSGLGLTMVHRIVTDHDGVVTVLSAPGRGTEMTVFLPAAAAVPVTPGAMPSAPAAVTLAGHSILVVDDDALVLSVTATALRRKGWTVSAHEHPGEALAAFARTPEGFSAILTDLTMPHQNGLDLAQHIRRQNAHVPIVIMTGHLTSRAQEQGAQVPNLHFIQKPFEMNQLLALLSNAVSASAVARG